MSASLDFGLFRPLADACAFCLGPWVPRFFHLGVTSCLLVIGCSKSPDFQPAAASNTAAAPAGPAVAEADLAPVLAELTQAIRKFSFEQKRRPNSLDELVTAGYLGAVPTTADGRRFSIDPKTMQVVVIKP